MWCDAFNPALVSQLTMGAQSWSLLDLDPALRMESSDPTSSLETEMLQSQFDGFITLAHSSSPRRDL